MTKATTSRTNTYAGWCTSCGTSVDAGGGHLTRQDGRWVVRCAPCTTSPTDAVREAIQALAATATKHGDTEMAGVCEQALGGDAVAWKECQRVLAETAAQAGGARRTRRTTTNPTSKPAGRAATKTCEACGGRGGRPVADASGLAGYACGRCVRSGGLSFG